MITDIEKLLIKTFIDKRIADRMLYEFDSDKKRRCGENRFAHSTDKIIDHKKLVKADKKLTVEDILGFIRQNSQNETCHTVVGHYELSGKETALQKAIETAHCWPGHSAIFVLPNVAIIIEEQTFGPPTRYLLLDQ